MVLKRFNEVCYNGRLYNDLIKFSLNKDKKSIFRILWNIILEFFLFFGVVRKTYYYTSKWFFYYKLSENDKNDFIKLVKTHLRSFEIDDETIVIDGIPEEVFCKLEIKRSYGVTFHEETNLCYYDEAQILAIIQTKIGDGKICIYDSSNNPMNCPADVHNSWKRKKGDRFCSSFAKDFCKISILSILLLLFTLFNTSSVVNLKLFFSYFKDIQLLIFNFLPILILMIILYLITSRIWLSFGITGLVTFIFSMINFFKLKYRNEPFVLSDILLISESKDMAGKYGLIPRIYQVLMFCLIVYIVYRCYKLYRVRLHMTLITRVAFTIILVSTSFFFYQKYAFQDKVYENLGDINAIESRWSGTQQYQRRGFIYPFLHSSTYAVEKEPDNYDVQKANKTLEQYETENIPEDKKVNVIAIMLEAYSDLSLESNLEFNEDVYGVLHRLQDESFHGSLITSIFGGGTIATERSFLTGYINHPDYLKKTNSYVHYLAEQGYSTYAFHPCYGWFYNRQNINQYLGFEEFYYVENYFEKITYDDELFDTLINHFTKTTEESEKPYFNFTVTYQGHGPYAGGDIGNLELIKKDESYNVEMYHTVNNYLNQIYSTNQNIDRLINVLRKSKEPTVLILFGDHKPMLGEDLAGYNMMEMETNLDTIQGWKNYYEVPYILWGNEASKTVLGTDLKGEGPDLSPNYLMSTIFEKMGWEGNSFMQYSRNVQKEISIMNSVYHKVFDEYITIDNQLESQVYLDYVNVEYYESHR